ncbi:MAG: hypothetical protein ACXWXA_07675 [Candidatus Limnocylindrales bacterium]
MERNLRQGRPWAVWVARFDRARWGQPVAVGLTFVFIVIGLAEFAFGWMGPGQHIVGLDIGHYLDGTRRWLETGTPYLPNEVAGPFLIAPETYLQPPVAVWLFAPFLVLPLVLWWAIPLGIVVWSIVDWQPAAWTWPIIAALLSLSRFMIPLIVGNTDLWVWAAIAVGLRWGWPSLLVAVKPSLFFFMFIGVRRRAWWIAAAVTAVLCLPFAGLWFDWIAVLGHAPKDFTYSLPNVPWLIVPILAWLARARPDGPMSLDRIARLVKERTA